MIGNMDALRFFSVFRHFSLRRNVTFCSHINIGETRTIRFFNNKKKYREKGMAAIEMASQDPCVRRENENHKFLRAAVNQRSLPTNNNNSSKRRKKELFCHFSLFLSLAFFLSLYPCELVLACCVLVL